MARPPGRSRPVLDEAGRAPSWGPAASGVCMYIYIYTHIYIYVTYTQRIYLYVSWPQVHLGSGLFPGLSPGRLFPLRTPWVEWGQHRREGGGRREAKEGGALGKSLPVLCSHPSLGRCPGVGGSLGPQVNWSILLASVLPRQDAGCGGLGSWSGLRLPGWCPRANPLEA